MERIEINGRVYTVGQIAYEIAREVRRGRVSSAWDLLRYSNGSPVLTEMVSVATEDPTARILDEARKAVLQAYGPLNTLGVWLTVAAILQHAWNIVKRGHK